MNCELPDVQAGFRKGRGTRNKIANICWIIEKARRFQKNIYFFFIDYAKAFDSVDHNKLWKIFQEMGIPNHPTCLLRNLYASQEAIVRTGCGTTDWVQIGKDVCQGCILSPCFFNLYAEYIIGNVGLEEAQAGIKIARENINKLRYADDITFMAESEELKNFPQFIVIHTVKGFGIVNKAEIDVFLELSCFFDDPDDVGNLISGSSAFSKTSLNIWKFTLHVIV